MTARLTKPLGRGTSCVLAIVLSFAGCGDDDERTPTSSGGFGGATHSGGAGAVNTAGGAGAGASGATGGAGGEAGSGGAVDCAVVSCRYLRADAPAGGEGLDWSTAFDSLPEEPERGAVYLVASGDYPSLMLDAPEIGQAWIELRKATASDHGTEAGWVPRYGEGQASFPDIVLVSDFWIVDGRIRDEADWSNVAAYGFRVGSVVAHTINFGRGSNDVIIRAVDVGGPPNGVFDESLPREGFYFGGFDAVLSRWLISRCHVHDVYLPFQLAGASEVTIERSWLGPNWSKETIRGQTHAARITVRYNVLKDGCQGTPGDPTAGACTAQIAMWDNDVPGSFDGSEIYGNVFWTTKSTPHSDGCVLVGGDDGVSAAGVAANDVVVANNTFVGVAEGRCSIRMPGSHSGDVVANNVWYGLGGGVATECEANRCEHNEVLAASAFVDAIGGNFRLAQPTNPGTTLPAPYDVDLTGQRRGVDGTWDLGAFEYSE